MPTHVTPVPFKPSDLLERLKRTINGYWTQPEGEDGAFTYSTSGDWTGRDNWSVHTFVTVTAPDGTEHRLRLEIHDLPQEPGDLPLRP